MSCASAAISAPNDPAPQQQQELEPMYRPKIRYVDENYREISEEEARALAEEPEGPSVEEQQAAYFRKMYGEVRENVSYRDIDRAAVSQSREWAKAKNVPKPILRKDGAVSYVYGSSTPRIICRTLRVTDIALQPGEVVSGAPAIGDSVNWNISPASSGTGENATVHILIKPQMPDLVTNMVVHTDRRTYIFELVSHRKDHTPYVTFSYPEWDQQKDWDRFMAQLRRGRPQAAPRSAYVPPTLNRAYSITGRKDIPWYPKEVSDDGKKTYITLSEKVAVSEYPVFYILRGKRKELVNYRTIDNAIVIDRLFDHGILVAGAGAVADQVFISRRKSFFRKETVPPPQTEGANDMYGGN